MDKSLKNILSNHFDKDTVIELINTNQGLFEEAIELALQDIDTVSWRAAWVINQSMKSDDVRIKKYTKNILEAIKSKKDGHQRELLKIIEQMEVCDELGGLFFDICMNIWATPTKDVSARIIAFRIIVNFAKKYPELANEIKVIATDDYAESLSQGIKHTFYRLKKELAIVRQFKTV